MRIKRAVNLIQALSDDELKWIEPVFREVRDAIHAVNWPLGSGSFTINPVPKGNGVRPIKSACVQRLVDHGWAAEHRLAISGPRPGPIDAVKTLETDDMIALEWETGNISSSHRAVNKMALGMLHGQLLGGILILPSREMCRYLTDRIGNFQELEPYFPVWQHVGLERGFLQVIEVEHDAESADVPRVPKGTDGWNQFQ